MWHYQKNREHTCLDTALDTSDNVTLGATVSSVGGYTKIGAKVARRRPMSRQFPSTPIEFLCWIRVPRIWSDLITAFQKVASASDFVMVQCWICCGVTRGFVAGPWSRISWLVVAKWNPWSSRSSRDHLGAVIIGDQAAIWSSLINDCHSWLKVSFHHEYNLLKPLLRKFASFHTISIQFLMNHNDLASYLIPTKIKDKIFWEDDSSLA